MAAAKKTKKTKPKASKTSAKTVAKKSTKSKPSKKSGTTKTTTKKTTTKKTSTKVTSKKLDFIADVVKQATKAQKAAQSATKALAKQLNGLDKELVQLTKKQGSAKGKSWQTLESKVAKLKTQCAVVRTALLNSENNEDKIASLAEYALQLNSRSAPSSYLPALNKAPSKPTLVKTPVPNKNTKNVKPVQEDYLDEDDYPDEEDLDLDDDNEEIGFVFGEDDDLQDDELAR